MENILSFNNVSLRKGARTILSDISWKFRENEQWAVLGLNGSGKTSLLNVIMGYHYPSDGEVTVLGNNFGKTNLQELRKEIGFVSTSLDRFSQLTNNEKVEEIIVSGKFASFGLYENVSPMDWAKADSLLDSFRLSYLKGKLFHLLSQGEKRRVLIARSLMSDPKVLILDEPCTGLDILSREEVLHLTKEVIGKDRHLIFVTHHIEELVKEITHVLLLHEGKVVAAGPKVDVLDADLLSKTFEVPVKVRWEEERPWLTIKTPVV
ncbi:ABC transporter ATP-binding protein [Sporosarcina limicola]|uniref:Iron complex transport system ATP-binding protein n=1 Tax=Sporosarcina limicola TaxID=34101 RepID=A0A927MGQ6_9BACL|nr:ABC transporter ATP-binding protein [Sporosarcina limicola]MBE1554285.1 iron complex transport system ATP-binding protein [Sporosarcina limicola]